MSKKNQATISWISGPVLHARTRDAFCIYEAVLVGERELLGEIIRIEDDQIVIQVYEDTSGMRPGDRISGTGMPLSVKLGPYILGHIFDGLLRPLSRDGDKFIYPGARAARPADFDFTPAVTSGQKLSPGCVIGNVTLASGKSQSCLLTPDLAGEVISVVNAGRYFDNQAIATLRDAGGKVHEIQMNHWWPVRQARPVQQRYSATSPLLTG
ncbi:MAG: hypothetical protein OEY28_03265, partial [Nitrospira sp.]|nr:hypothetical protein [Nitrospira sp.]